MWAGGRFWGGGDGTGSESLHLSPLSPPSLLSSSFPFLSSFLLPPLSLSLSFSWKVLISVFSLPSDPLFSTDFVSVLGPDLI